MHEVRLASNSCLVGKCERLGKPTKTSTTKHAMDRQGRGDTTQMEATSKRNKKQKGQAGQLEAKESKAKRSAASEEEEDTGDKRHGT